MTKPARFSGRQLRHQTRHIELVGGRVSSARPLQLSLLDPQLRRKLATRAARAGTTRDRGAGRRVAAVTVTVVLMGRVLVGARRGWKVRSGLWCFDRNRSTTRTSPQSALPDLRAGF